MDMMTHFEVVLINPKVIVGMFIGRDARVRVLRAHYEGRWPRGRPDG